VPSEGYSNCGRKFTWYKPNSTTRSRLDRAIVSDEWLLQWPGSKQYVLSRQVSDHYALVVKNSIVDWGPKPFRSFDVWHQYEGFREDVKEAWDNTPVRGNVLEDIKNKFKKVKCEIKQWYSVVNSSVRMKKKELVAQIEELDNCDDEDDLCEEEIILRGDLLSQLRRLEEKEEAMLKQKSRVEWIKNGDSNSKFFHSKLRWRRGRNDLVGIRIDGSWCEDPISVKSQVKQFFGRRFEAPLECKLRLDGVNFSTISECENAMLCGIFTEEEVLEAVSQCGSSKCPGPDGFNFLFIKNNWEIIGKDVVKAILFFQSSGYLPRGCNASFITLVPKKANPSELNEYRPISLVGCIYKILSKVLANRLSKVLPSVIDVNQFAFLEGRGLLDNVLVANETVDFLKREKKSGVLVKVDFGKAYNSVNWKFLYYMLDRLGFSPIWIKWIKACLESASVSVLVNGSPTEEFKPKRGLRHGIRWRLSSFL